MSRFRNRIANLNDGSEYNTDGNDMETPEGRMVLTVGSEKSVPVPFFSCGNMTVIWASFLYGIYIMYGHNESNLSWNGPVSPPYEPFIFKTISSYPQCHDKRIEMWRLLSVQFVHGGLGHIIGNTLCGLILGGILETMTGFIFTVVVFESSVVFGAMAHSCSLPYQGLIGCSHGVYGWLGALTCCSIYGAILSVTKLRDRKWFYILLAFVLVLIIGGDISGYFCTYNPNLAYEAHAGGFLTGFLLTVVMITLWSNCNEKSFKCCRSTSKFHSEISSYPLGTSCTLACTLLLIGFLLALVIRFSVAYPLGNEIQTAFHPQYHTSCCQDYFSILCEQTNFTKNYITEHYYCSYQNRLLFKGQ